MTEREKMIEAIIDAMIRTDLPTWGVRTVKEVARTQYLKRAEAALATLEAAGGWAPPGHWIAPDEATEVMREQYKQDFTSEARFSLEKMWDGLRTASLEERERTE